MKAHILKFIFLFFGIGVFAQPIHTVDMAPAAMSMSSDVSDPIVITFDASLNTSTVTASSFLVFGRWSGPMSGQYAFSNSDTVVTFTPDRDFIHGEWITVRLTSSVEGAGGGSLENGFGANYWTRSLPGSLDLTFTGQLSMRQSGEGLVQCYGAYAGDLNDDDFSDLVVVTENSNDIRVLLNDHTGNYSNFTVIEMPNSNRPSTNEGADFDHDGRIDMAIGSTLNNNLSVMMGHVTDLFEPEISYQAGQNIRGLTVTDVNGDGWDDIITANYGANNLSLFINDGTGTFNSAVSIETGSSGERSIAATDLNGDGFIDLIVATNTSNEVLTMLNDGTGTFTVTDTVTVGSGPWMVAIGDVDGDGNVDVAVTNANSANVSIVTTDGSGGLDFSANYAVGALPVAVDLGDIDGDGDLDFIASSFSASNYILWENNGSGTFINPRTYPSPEAGSCAVLHDKDNNGTIDITMIDEIADVLLFYTNDPALATNDLDHPWELVLYPNPFDSKIGIMGEISDAVLFTLYDPLGRILNQQFVSARGEIDLSSLALSHGMYFARLEQNDRTQIVKLYKK